MEADGEYGWYSVWAQPSPLEEPHGLRPAMQHLRTLFQAPAFEPHVTVLGVGTQKISLRQACLSLRSATRVLPPYTCRLMHPACGDSFYQCVYMLVDPSHEVVRAHKVLEGTFESEQLSHATAKGYMPHMSLLYADLSAEDKEKARLLVEDSYGPQLCNTEFRVSTLSLYSTDINDRQLTSWKKVGEFPLEG